MCLGIPGKIIEIADNEAGFRMAKVDFGDVVREAGLQITPDAKIGDYVIVHAGFAIEVLDEEEAAERLKLFEELAKDLPPVDTEQTA